MKIFAHSRPTATATPDALAHDMDREVATGRRYYEEGFIEQAYMDVSFTETFMILEAENVDAARTKLAEYPHVKRGLIAFEVVPIVGLPAVERSFSEAKLPRPAWWPHGPDRSRDNRARAMRFFAEALGQRSRPAFEELVAPDVVVHSGLEPFRAIRGREAYWEALGRLGAFTMESFEMEDLFSTDDRVVARFRAKARHTGDALGVPATQKSIVMWEIHSMKWDRGQLVENFAADINYDWPWLVAPAHPDGIGRTGREGA